LSEHSRLTVTADAINLRLEKLLPFFAPLGVALGFLLPGVFIQLRPFVVWIFGLITFSGSLKLRVVEFGRTVRSPLPILLAFVSRHVIMPLLALFLSAVFFSSDTDTITGFILLYCGPAAVSGFIWTGIYRGDGALSLTLILLDTLLAPLVVPGTVLLLLGTKTTINAAGIALSLICMVVAPTIIGVLINEASRGEIPKLICPCLNPVSKIGLILVIAANSSPIAPQLRINDPMVWKTGGLCVTLVVIGFVLAKLTGIAGRLGRKKQISLFFASGLRNISSVTTIAVTYFPAAAVLPALLGIVFQQAIAALMSKLLMGRGKDDD
jgi:tagaturonate reductase